MKEEAAQLKKELKEAKKRREAEKEEKEAKERSMICTWFVNLYLCY